MKSVMTVCLSPTFQLIITFKSFIENEVNRSTSNLLVASGKGINVSRVLTRLGRETVNLTQLGGPRVDEFISLCMKDGLEVRYVPVRSDIRSCITVINEEKGSSTELVEEAREVDEKDGEAFFSLFLSEIDKHEAVVISGTKAKGFPRDLYPRIVAECNRRGKLVVLDIKGEELKACLKCNPTIIKPNLPEFVQTFMDGKTVYENQDNEDLKEEVAGMTEQIFAQYGAKTVITRGKYDTWVYDGNDFFSVPSKSNVKVVNTIGCGDTFTGAMTDRLLAGDSLKDAVAFGMECATRKASHLEQRI